MTKSEIINKVLGVIDEHRLSADMLVESDGVRILAKLGDLQLLTTPDEWVVSVTMKTSVSAAEEIVVIANGKLSQAYVRMQNVYGDRCRVKLAEASKKFDELFGGRDA